jgi:hypothetical protein
MDSTIDQIIQQRILKFAEYLSDGNLTLYHDELPDLKLFLEKI